MEKDDRVLEALKVGQVGILNSSNAYIVALFTGYKIIFVKVAHFTLKLF